MVAFRLLLTMLTTITAMAAAATMHPITARISLMSSFFAPKVSFAFSPMNSPTFLTMISMTEAPLV